MADDSKRLDWLLTLIWDTGHRDNDANDALARLKALRRRICDSNFPFREAIDAAMNAEEEVVLGTIVDIKPEDLKTACGKVYEMLKGQFWTEGGWLSCIGEGKDQIIVMTTRKLHAFEAKKIPKEMDGIPIQILVTGKMRLN